MRRHRTLLVLMGIALVLVAVRAALPELLARYVERVIDRSDRYTGQIQDVDLALWRGGYTIEGLRLDHALEAELPPLIRAARIDLSIEWGALLKGALVGEVEAQRLVYNVVAAPPAAEGEIVGEEPGLADPLSELLPLSINRFEVRDSELHYRDPHSTPKVDIALTDVHLLATNWSNVRDAEADRFGRAWVRGRAFKSARFAGSLDADPLASPPEFRFAALTEGVALAELNDFLRAYGGFDAEEGLLSLYAEADAKNGRYQGYVKPVIRGLDVLGGEESRDGWLDKAWEGVVGIVAEIFENQFSDRQATRIPIEGEWGDASPDLLDAVASVLYNAFVQALPAHLDHPERLVREAPEA